MSRHPKNRAERRVLHSLKDLDKVFKGDADAVPVPHENAEEEFNHRSKEHPPRSVQGSSDFLPDRNQTG